MRPAHQNRRHFGIGAGIVLALLLVVPIYALSQLTSWIDVRWLAGVALALSLFAFFAQRHDKQRAESGGWRTPESVLHGAELFGGWPGAFLAQRIFRHKISKARYQFTFWLIVLLHQIIALDSLLGFQYARSIYQFLTN